VMQFEFLRWPSLRPSDFRCFLCESLACFAGKIFNREAREERPRSPKSGNQRRFLKLHHYQIRPPPCADTMRVMCLHLGDAPSRTSERKETILRIAARYLHCPRCSYLLGT
jgi:hypothetical protein